MTFKLRKYALASIAAAASLGVASMASAQIDMKIGYPTTADPQHDYAVKFVAEVNKRTNGRVKGRVFPTSQLGKIPGKLGQLNQFSQFVDQLS